MVLKSLRETGVGYFNDENPLKGPRCVRRGGLQWLKPLKIAGDCPCNRRYRGIGVSGG